MTSMMNECDFGTVFTPEARAGRWQLSLDKNGGLKNLTIFQLFTTFDEWKWKWMELEDSGFQNQFASVLMVRSVWRNFWVFEETEILESTSAIRQLKVEE